MKKFAAMLMLVCSLGVFAIVGCGDTKTTTPATSTDKMAPTDKMTPTDKDKMAPGTPPSTPPTPPPTPSK